MKKFTLIVFLVSFSFVVSAQMPGGTIAMFQLDNSAADIGGNNHNGTLSATTATTNRFGTGNRATIFTAGSSVGDLPVSLVTAVSSDFTMGFWFRTTMVAPTSAQWYSGSALVDAEMCGETSDWGTALIDGGRVALGIGSPDITIKSTASNYNDGNWHFVTVTRNRTSGTVILYMEGVQVATSSGTYTGALNAPSSIRLGSNPCAPSTVYTGSLDDLVFYNRVLSSTEIASLYNQLNAFVLPLRWVLFTADVRNGQAKLQWQVEDVVNNHHFDVEHSIDGVHYFVKGSVGNGAGTVANSGLASYLFSDATLSSGTNFYRIKQVDVDGKFTYSKTLQLKIDLRNQGLRLLSNPASSDLVLMNGDQQRLLRLQVTDMAGRILIDKPLQSTATAVTTRIGSLKPGNYLLKVRSMNGVVTIPWIKQ